MSGDRAIVNRIAVKVNREACVEQKSGLPTFLCSTLSKKKPTVPDLGPEVRRRLQSGVGRRATFLKAAGGIKAFQIHFASLFCLSL
jgi:hypothetical protein